MGCNGKGFKVPVLAILRHEEGIRLDPDPLTTLYAELGERGAEQVLGRAMEELSARMTDMFRQADDGRDVALVGSARLLAKMAAQVGMATLARVAIDVVSATEAADRAAQAAILTRLARIGERSQFAIWDLRDIRL